MKMTVQRDNPETREFWARVERDELSVGHCNGCGEVHYYPRAICPFCFSDDTALKAVSGRGEVLSYSIISRGEPYVLALVTLEEGVSMLTNIVTDDPGAVFCGMKVAVTFQDGADGAKAPMFVPSAN
ncbi:MAG: OB-fold domain-containing protein [Rhodobiaceae bacterium]|nr:OB-fold domain-containing protein [Rhodobiaceae bacterium]MCC0056204.1 OB-fold domain-containing protein [Rhodobiaceae bacterium]